MNIIVITTGLKMDGAETILLHMVKEWLKKDLKVNILLLSSVCYLDGAFVMLGVEVKIRSSSSYLIT